jgi:hypothetical protein
MNLELAVTSSCTDSGCQVKLLRSDEAIATKYSDLVRDRIQIEPQQLVAIDMGLPIPEIVWRWVGGTVLEVNDNSVGIEGRLGKLGFANRVATLPLKLSIGDEVWFCNTDKDLEVHSRIVGGKPSNPHQLLKYITPIIARIYLAETD